VRLAMPNNVSYQPIHPVVNVPTVMPPFVHRAIGIVARSSEPLTATGFPRLGFHFGARPRTVCGLDADIETAPYADLIGQASRHAAYDTGDGFIDSFVVEISPFALKALLKTDDASLLTDRRIPLESLFGPAVRNLHDHLAAATNNQRVSIISHWIDRQIADTARAIGLSQAVISLIDASGGIITISDLSSRLGVSRRWVEKKFLREVGLKPKQYARIVRCQAAARALNSRDNLSTLSITHGYADQPHMTREFKSLLGMSPGGVIRNQYHNRFQS
jgi:AraC-like DNA-binding protein